MDKEYAFVGVIGALFVLVCALVVLQDIIKAAYHQFKDDGYEWFSVKVLREKREWWKWAIALLIFAIGTYWLLPNAIVGKADFRAYRQKPEYTAYYRCEYDIGPYGEGEGYAELIREDSQYKISKIYTINGFILINHTLTENEELGYRIDLSFCCEDDSSVRLMGNPVKKEIAQAGSGKEVFGHPNPTKEYCLSCRSCGAGYYPRCMNSSEWLCPDCTNECKTYCARCDELFPSWSHTGDGFVLCDYCLSILFESEQKQDLVLD